MRLRIIVILAMMTAASIVIIFLSAISYFRSEEVGEANARLSLYSRSLNETLQRFQHLPYVLARDSVVIDVAGENLSPELLNGRLEEFARESTLEAIYLMNTQGDVLSASNFATPQSFVGKNYGFRPYFLSSSNGIRGEFFGVGATTGRPGYFVSEQVVDANGEYLGVIAIKLDMSELQAVWESAGENVFVSNADGVVVLSSNPDWLYKLLNSLNAEQLETIKRGRQFGSEPLERLDWQQNSETEATFQSNRFVYVQNSADRLGWTVHYLLGEERIFERATLTTAIFGVGIICLVLFSTFLRSRRISTALAISQSDRKQLQKTNAELETAQSELKKTSKLAALGQLSASVTHELGQPISALRNYLTAAEMSGDLADEKMRSRLFNVAARMENITKQLRFFVRSDSDEFSPVNMIEVVRNARELLEHKINASNIQINETFDLDQTEVSGNQMRLEQVVVNLLSNSIGALEENNSGEITISTEQVGPDIYLHIEDNGIGFDGRSIEVLTEPFHTTKASGEGMGLGLSIASEIIREHGGKIHAKALPKGGSKFSVSLPILCP